MKNVMTGVLVIAALFLGYATGYRGVLIGASSSTGPQHYSQETFQKGFQVGPRGTPVANVLKGTCALIAPGTITATSTRNVDCAVAGVLSGDSVYSGGLASTTMQFAGLNVVAVRASTTAGFLTFTLVNFTGATYTFGGSGYGSSTPYLVIR